MINYFKSLLFFLSLTVFFISCDSLTGEDEDEDDLPIYVAPLTINNFEVTNVTQFNFDVSWDITDGNGKIVEPDDINYTYETDGGTLFLNGSGSGNGFSPDINYLDGGSAVNLTAICGQEIILNVNFDVARLEFEFNETKTLEFTPPKCEYGIKLISEYSGGNSSSCDYYSEYTFTAFNATYENEFGEDVMPLYFTGGTDAMSEDGLIQVEILDSQVSSLVNGTVTEGAYYSFGDFTNFRILGPQVDKADCSQEASYDFSAGVVLIHLPDNTQVAVHTIDDSFSF